MLSCRPPRQAYSHSASVGSRYSSPSGRLPAFRSWPVSHLPKARPSFQLTQTTGKSLAEREGKVRIAPALALHRLPRMDDLGRQVVAGPVRIEALRVSARLLRVGDVLGLFDELPELADGDFGAAHPEPVRNAGEPRLLAFIGFAFGVRRRSPFDAGGPLLLFRRAPHEELSGGDVDRFQKDDRVAPQVGPPDRSFGGLGTAGGGGREEAGGECSAEGGDEHRHRDTHGGKSFEVRREERVPVDTDVVREREAGPTDEMAGPWLREMMESTAASFHVAGLRSTGMPAFLGQGGPPWLPQAPR